MSRLTMSITPQRGFYLVSLAQHNPTRSWWLEASPEGFTRVCEREATRMRLSKYGNTTCAPGKPGMGTIEAHRASKAMDGRAY
jgi:hypothetical protein